MRYRTGWRPARALRMAALALAFSPPLFAQHGPVQLQQLQQRFAQERLELQRRQALTPSPATPDAQQRLDQSQQQRQWLLQERQRREALTFEQQTRHLSEPEQRLGWQAEQQRLQRERDAQMLRFQQERP